MTKFKQRFNARIKKYCKAENGKSQIKVGDMRQALVNFAIDYAKDSMKEHFFLMKLAGKHKERKLKARK